MTNRNNHNFNKLKVWQEAISVVVEIYEETAKFPYDEKFGIISQIRRAAVSIPSNIAEGSAKGTNADFIRFLYIAKGSIAELITLFTISNKLNLISESANENLSEKLIQIDSSIYKLINTLDKQS